MSTLSNRKLSRAVSLAVMCSSVILVGCNDGDNGNVRPSAANTNNAPNPVIRTLSGGNNPSALNSTINTVNGLTNGVLTPVTSALNPVITPLGVAIDPLLNPVLSGLQPILSPLVSTISPVTATLAPITDSLLPLTNVLGNTLAPTALALAPTSQALSSAVSPLASAIGPVAEGAHDAVRPLTNSVGNAVTPVLQGADTVIAPVTETLTPVINAAGEVLQPALSPVAGLLGATSEALDIQAIGPLSNIVGPVVGAASDVVTGTLYTASGLTGVVAAITEPVFQVSGGIIGGLNGSTFPIAGVVDNIAVPLTTPIGAALAQIGGQLGTNNQSLTQAVLAGISGGTSNTLLDPVIGSNGLVPLTTAGGNQTLADPLVGKNGVLPLTSGEARNGQPALLDPVIGESGVVALTSAEGNVTPLDPLIGQRGLVPLTSNVAGTGAPVLNLNTAQLAGLGNNVLVPVTEALRNGNPQVALLPANILATPNGFPVPGLTPVVNLVTGLTSALPNNPANNVPQSGNPLAPILDLPQNLLQPPTLTPVAVTGAGGVAVGANSNTGGTNVGVGLGGALGAILGR